MSIAPPYAYACSKKLIYRNGISGVQTVLIVNWNFGYALFPFNSARRLACYIQHYAVYFANFVSYAI